MKTGVIWKKVGETPLQALRRFRMRYVIPESVPLTYSGRLDPMAQGKILILVGDECKKEKHYRSLDKQYEVRVLLGVSTDTGDVLGLITAQSDVPTNHTQSVQKIVASFVGYHTWPYPKFSSKTVQGKPLHQWAREGKAEEIELPLTKTHIQSIRLVGEEWATSAQVMEYVRNRLDDLRGFATDDECKNLREPKVRKAWEDFFATNSRNFCILTIHCVCGSGTYMRTLSEHIGKQLGTPALAYSITRTKIGRRRTFLGLTWWWPRW